MKSDNYKDSNLEKKLIPNMKQRSLRAITFQGATEKSPILLSQFDSALKTILYYVL